MAKADGKWLSPVTNFNNINYNGYAGITNKPMTAVAIKVGKGSIRYRIHAKRARVGILGSLAMTRMTSIMAMPETGRTSLMEYR